MPTPLRTVQEPEQHLRGSSVAGYATATGTKRFADRSAANFSPDFYREMTDGVSVSSLGMGTYLGDCDDTEDARYVTVLTAGFEQGLNLVDTAINYRCQRSERAAGLAIRRAIDLGYATRDEIVVSTKGGYIPLDRSPPESRALYDAYLTSEYFDRGVMTAADVVSGGHSLVPRFLANQIRRSLDNLGLDTVDVYYLHNPEQQFSSPDSERFRNLMFQAFTELESHVRDGRIRAYGCATWNGFRLDPSSSGHLCLEEIVGIAREAGGVDHHFRVVQLPLNLAMPEAVRVPSQLLAGRRVSFLQAATELGISVVASASLMQSQLTHGLPRELAAAFPSLETDAQRAIAFVRSLPVCAALVGMRRIEHLSENLEAGRSVIPA